MAHAYGETVLTISTLFLGAMMGFTLAETGAYSAPEAGDYYVISSTKELHTEAIQAAADGVTDGSRQLRW